MQVKSFDGRLTVGLLCRSQGGETNLSAKMSTFLLSRSPQVFCSAFQIKDGDKTNGIILRNHSHFRLFLKYIDLARAKSKAPINKFII